MTDTITVLRARDGKQMTKRWLADGTIADYDKALFYRVETYPVQDVQQLSRLLGKLEVLPDACVIRGVYEPPPGPTERVTRRLDTTVDRPHHWLLIDVDRYQPLLSDPLDDPLDCILEYIDSHLPPEFCGASFHWQLSPSAGAAKNAGLLKAHLWFWSETAYDSEQLTAWGHSLPVGTIDLAVMRQVQPHYTSAPIIDEGASCPVRQRSGFYQGFFGDAVPLVLDESMLRQARERTRVARHAMVDPTAKPGLVGAFCRAYPPERVINEVLAEDFEFAVGSEHRITWHGGGGAPEGVAISDDGHHLFNTHNTDPFKGRAVNTWDFVRVHKFGHHDEGVDELDRLDDTHCPSQRAMARWAEQLPDVQAAREAAAEAALNYSTDDSPTADSPGAAGSANYSSDADALDDGAAAPESAKPAKPNPEHVKQENRLHRAINLITSCQLAETLKTDVATKLREAKFDEMEREQLAVALQGRLRELTSARPPIALVRRMLQPVKPSVFTDMTEDGKPLPTIGNVQAVLDSLNATVRYNLIRRDVEIGVPGVRFVNDTKTEALSTRVVSECVARGLPAMKGLVNDYLDAIASENAYNPVLEWIDSEPWDGRSRLADLAATIEVAEDKRELRDTLLYRWLLSCVAIAANEGNTMARGVLVFQGAQNMGKTSWLRSLVPSELGVVHTGQDLKAGNRDSEKKLTSFWLSEFGELDATFKKADQSAVKAFISQTDDVMRLAFGRREVHFRRRTAFFGTVNDDQFLRDKTGDTRFWVLAVLAVRPDHGIDMQQLWAEVATHQRAGEQHWLTKDEEKLLDTSNEQHRETDPIDELIATRLRWDGTGELVRETATQIAIRIGIDRPTRVDVNAVSFELKKRNCRNSRSAANGARQFEIMVDDVL